MSTVSLYDIRVCFNEKDMGSVFDMLRYDSINVTDLDHFIDRAELCIGGLGYSFTENRWKSFGLKPMLVRTAIVAAAKPKKVKQVDICASGYDVSTEGNIQAYNTLLKAIRGKNVRVGHLSYTPKEVCLVIKGEADEIEKVLLSEDVRLRRAD